MNFEVKHVVERLSSSSRGCCWLVNYYLIDNWRVPAALCFNTFAAQRSNPHAALRRALHMMAVASSSSEQSPGMCAEDPATSPGISAGEGQTLYHYGVAAPPPVLVHPMITIRDQSAALGDGS